MQAGAEADAGGSWLGSLYSAWVQPLVLYLFPPSRHRHRRHRLIRAVSSGDRHSTQELLAGGREDPNQRNEAGETPLWKACSRWDLELVRLLLDHPGVRINLCDNLGRTPLAIACEVGCRAIVEELLKGRRAAEAVCLLGAMDSIPQAADCPDLRNLLLARARWPKPLHPCPAPTTLPLPLALEEQTQAFLEVFLASHWVQIELSFEFLACLPPAQAARILAHLKECLHHRHHRAMVRSSLMRPFLSRALFHGSRAQLARCNLFEIEALVGCEDPAPGRVWFSPGNHCFEFCPEAQTLTRRILPAREGGGGGGGMHKEEEDRIFRFPRPCVLASSPQFDQLQHLDLSRTGLIRVPGDLPALLWSLDLSHNPLAVILPTAFRRCLRLEWVLLEGNDGLVFPPPGLLHPHEVVPFLEAELAEFRNPRIREIADTGPNACCLECGSQEGTGTFAGVVALGYFVCCRCYHRHRASTWTDARVVDLDGWSRYHEVLFEAVGNERARAALTLPAQDRRGHLEALVQDLLCEAYGTIGRTLSP